MWNQAQKWEKKWWGDCTNTFGEEIKQLLYVKRMGLKFTPDKSTPYRIEMQGKRVLDIGGGPTSLLLKCVDVDGTVADPIVWPGWVLERYRRAEIKYVQIKGEELLKNVWIFDECWIYNCLQHVERPEIVLKKVMRIGKIVRIFEWIETGTNSGHPQNLTEAKLNYFLGGIGAVEEIKGESGCWGKCYYGIFKGEKYENQEI